jgi:snapalysin
MTLFRFALLSAWLLVSCGSEPLAQARQELQGGRALGSCDWPSVGAIPGCTATLISPQWILTAAHCSSPGTFGLGGVSTSVAMCTSHPNFISSGRAYDFMVCRLNSPVAAPVIPLLAPCEATEVAAVGGGLPYLLPVGTPVTVLGLGSPTTGQKRAIEMQASSTFFSPPLINFQQPADLGGARPGDSGGPTFMRLGDGSWRQIGVHKLGGVGSSVTDVWVSSVVPWIELVTGEDLTPCHQGDQWSPSATCSTA